MDLLGETPALSPPMQNSSSPRDLEPKDIQKLQQWQDERQAKRLRGEYQSAVTHLGELINSSRSNPMRLHSVKVEGAHNTRKSFLGFIIDPILSQKGADDLDGVLHKARQISDVLQRTDLFNSVALQLEHSRHPSAGPHDLDAVFVTRERGRLLAKTATTLGNEEANGNVIVRLRNIFGGAEVLEGNMSVGTNTQRSFSAVLSAPISPDLHTRADLAVYGMKKDNRFFASSKEELRGMKVLVRNGYLTTGMNEFAYEAVLRNIGDLAPTASISIREAAGFSSKSSLSHTFTVDTRESPVVSNGGLYFKARSEWATLAGNARFFKSEGEAQTSRRLFPGITACLGMRSGIMWGLGRPTLLPDRFQLGGPTSIRAFKSNGLGMRDGVDSLGGDIYWALGLSVLSDIPKIPDSAMKLHTWINAGRLDVMQKSRSMVENVQATLARPSVSAGVGLVYNAAPIRVELNVGVPLVASASDSTRRGLQLGMGIEFL